MLDLDSLAEKRARSLNEQEELWRDAVWGADFQQAARSMSDGEVEIIVTSCPSLSHFRALVRFIKAHPQRENVTPFELLEGAAQGRSLSEWIASLPIQQASGN